MKRWTAALWSLGLLIALCACASQSPQPSKTPVEVALIFSEGGVLEENPFFYDAWLGIQTYCKEQSLACAHYVPETKNAQGYAACIDKAVQAGAKLVIAPTYALETPIYLAQDQYPDVCFVTVDGLPNNGASGEDYVELVAENTFAIQYAEEQAGFLAGYAAVMDGYRALGFMGAMAVPATARYGHGFVQGIDAAAVSLNLAKGAVSVRYLYCGNYTASPEIQSRASIWYLQGTEVIFASGGTIIQSVIAAAETAGRQVIGADIDQHAASSAVLTSAMKMVQSAVYDAVAAHHTGQFPGGESIRLGADTQGIALPIATSRFRVFHAGSYNALCRMLSTDYARMASSIVQDDVALGDIPLQRAALLVETRR